MGSKEWYFKYYIPILQVITVSLMVLWCACIIGTTIQGVDNGVISVDYTPYAPLLLASASVGSVFTVSVLVGIICRW